MSNILIWEISSALKGGGQRVSYENSLILKKEHNIFFLLPDKGDFSTALNKNGIECFFSGSENLNYGKKSIFSVIRYCKMSIKQIYFATKVCKRVKADILYVPGPMAMPWGAIVGKILGIKVIWHVHHIFTDGKTKLLLNKLGKLDSVKKIICVSDTAGKQLSKDIIGKEVTVYNYVKRYNKQYKIRRELLGIPENSIVLINIGFIQEEKKQLEAMMCLKQLRDKNIDSYLLIVGSVKEGSENYNKELYEMINKNNLSERVKFLGFRDDVIDILHICNYTLVLGNEGFSLVALESFQAGVPVIATSFGGAAEVTKISGGGILCNADDVDSIVEKILYLQNNESELKKIILLGTIFEEYCRNKYEEKLKDAFGIGD